MFVLYENTLLPFLSTKEIAVTENLYDSSIKVEFNNYSNTIKNYIDNWFKLNEKKTIILSWSISGKKVFYLFKNGYPNLVNIDNQGRLSSFKFRFENCIDITRKYKISLLLKE